MKLPLLAVAFTALSACATPTTGIIPLGEGMSTVTRQGNGFWVSTDSLKTAAILEAEESCKSRSKGVKIVHTKEIQAAGGRWPEAQVIFKCE